jgi:phosphate-selective porin OprO/OprP
MELRRARLGVEGTAWYDVDYTLEFEFAEDGVDVTDALVEFKHIDPVSFMVGQFKTPNSLDEQTSSRFITFMERAQFTDAFELDRRLGAAVAVGGSNWQTVVGLFFQNSGVEDDAGPFKNTWGAVAARAHYAIPFGPEDKAFIHLGTSVRYRDCNNDIDDSGACGGDEVRYRERPFFHGTDRRTLNTDTIDNVESDIFWGPEFGLFHGPLAVKSEAGLLWGSREDGVPGENTSDFGPLWGAYVDVAYFVTGETQPYDKGEGALDRPDVKNPVFEGGLGAWEVAARFDYLSLEDASSGIEGGEQWTVVGGVNWWLNRWSKLQFNYAHTKVTGGPLTASGDYDVDGFGVRAQVDW